MEQKELDELFTRTLADGKLSRGERQALGQIFESVPLADPSRAVARARAFETIRGTLLEPRAKELIDWLEDVVGVLASDASASAAPSAAEVHFSPGEGCVRRIIGLMDAARRSADLCVFTITDDRISRSIQAAHRRGVKVRIVTDNEKAYDPGSDTLELGRVGIPVAVDDSPFHMHHKFAVVDGRILLTGSYNWTRGAADNNQENLIVTDDPRFVKPYVEEFERLWTKFNR